MKKFVAAMMALLVGVLVIPNAGAAPVYFTGSVTTGGFTGLANGSVVGLGFNFIASNTATAVVNTAFVNIGSQTWSNLLAPGTLTVQQNGAFKDVVISGLNFGPSTPAGFGSTISNLTFTISGAVNPSAVASTANIYSIARINQSTGASANGVLALFGGIPGGFSNVVFSGTTVPEPASMALLGGFGLVAAGGAWRRRRQAAAQA